MAAWTREGPGAPSCHGPLQQRSALVGLPRVPQGTILVVEGDDLPVAQAGRFAGVVQQQREQREYFRLAGLWPGLEVAGEQRRLRGQDLLAAQLADGAVTRGRDQPAGGG
jgi:hypothetical protein